MPTLHTTFFTESRYCLFMNLETCLGQSIHDPTFPKIFKSQLTFPEHYQDLNYLADGPHVS